MNAVNEADFTALHGATFRGLNEVVQYLVEHGANINARDFRGRTPFRIAEGAKQSFQFQSWPETVRTTPTVRRQYQIGRSRHSSRSAAGTSPPATSLDRSSLQGVRGRARSRLAE